LPDDPNPSFFLEYNPTDPGAPIIHPVCPGTEPGGSTDFDVTLPIELASFSAVEENGTILLSWETSLEKNNAGFGIERSTDGERFDEIGFVDGAGNSLEPRRYSFRDTEVLHNVKQISYRLRQVDFDGAVDYSPVIEVDAPVPDRFNLEQAYPNPFNGRTVINYDLPTSELVSLSVFDALGRQVQTLVNTQQEAGRYSVPFNAGGLTSGVYIYRIEAGPNVQSGRMLLVK